MSWNARDDAGKIRDELLATREHAGERVCRVFIVGALARGNLWNRGEVISMLLEIVVKRFDG